MAYCIKLQTAIEVSPVEVLLGYQPHTRLKLLKPNISSEWKRSSRSKSFIIIILLESSGSTLEIKICVKIFGEGHIWLPGMIQEVAGPVFSRLSW